MTFFTEKALTLKAFFFCRWAPDTCSDKSLFSQSTLREEGAKSPGVLNLSCDRIPNISFFEMQTFLRLQYKERAADLIWGSVCSNPSLHRAGHRGGDTQRTVSIQQARQLQTLSTAERKYRKYIRPMMIPVAPGKKQKKPKKETAGVFFVCLLFVFFVTTIQKSMCSACIGGSWCVHCLQWSEHQKKGVNRKTARV